MLIESPEGKGVLPYMGYIIRYVPRNRVRVQEASRHTLSKIRRSTSPGNESWAGVFEFLQFEERFRVSVDGRP